MTHLVSTTRRDFLTKCGMTGLAVTGTAMGITACQKHDGQSQSQTPPQNQTSQVQLTKDVGGHSGQGNQHCLANSRYDFYGEHQSGIVTPAQRHIYFLVVDLHTDDVKAIQQMFQDWTDYAVKLMQGNNILPSNHNVYLPPSDTGEADSLGAYGLTLTFGVSPSFFKKLKLTDKQPANFVDLPSFPRDQIRPSLSGGDICIQACAEDPQVAFHAVRQLVRQARSHITMKWSQAGFNAFDNGNHTPRNLFAFKDGTANQLTLQNPEKHLWISDDTQPAWLQGGTFLVARVIQMHLETWDRTSLKGQEDTFSRHRSSGAPIGSQHEFDALNIHATDSHGQPLIADTGHTALANQTGLQILRRSFSYSSGIDSRTGQFDAGLLFISFQQSPSQFIAIQNALGRMDKMNEYVTHIGSGLFACFGGVQSGGYIGQKLFDG